MKTSALLGAKHIGYFKIYDVLAGQGEGVPFLRILGGRPLWTDPYQMHGVKKHKKHSLK